MRHQIADNAHQRFERALLGIVVGRFESVARFDEGWRYGLEAARLVGNYPDTVLELGVVDRTSGERRRQSVKLWGTDSEGVVEVFDQIATVHRDYLATGSPAAYDDDRAVHARSVLATVVLQFHHGDIASNGGWALRGASMEGEFPDTVITLDRFDRSTGQVDRWTVELWRGALEDAAAGDLGQSAMFIWIWASGG